MKKFLDDLDTIYEVDRSKMHELMLTQFGTVVLSVPLAIKSSYYPFMLICLVAPALFFVMYFRYYKPMIRKVQKDIELQERYPYIYSKFINGGKE